MKSIRHLALFAKFWQPGQVKTRLAADVGACRASRIYFEFLSHLLAQLDQAGDQRTVVFSPPQRRAEFSEICGDTWEIKPQTDGDLGGRLKSFVRSAFSETRSQDRSPDRSPDKCDQVVIVGSDCPLLGRDTIETAFDRLDHCPVVLGPSHDGGYYLIGLNQPCDAVFENIAWSTPAVLQQTIAVLNKQKIEFDCLPEMSDVDEAADYARLIHDLSSPGPHSLGEGQLLAKLTNL